MTPTTQQSAVRWMVEVDDPLDLLRVNWQKHDPFTQNGMWDVDETTFVRGIRMMMTDEEGFKGYIIELYDRDEDATRFLAIATYDDKCQECGVQPHDSFFYPEDSYDEDGRFKGAAIDVWGSNVIHGMWDNASANGFEFNHLDGCQNGALSVLDEEAETVDAE